MGHQLRGDFSGNILHKHRIFVCPFGHILLILAFENTVHLARGRTFDDIDDLLKPNEPPLAKTHRHQASLIVGSKLADRLGTGTQRGDGHLHLIGLGHLASQCFLPERYIGTPSIPLHRKRELA